MVLSLFTAIAAAASVSATTEIDPSPSISSYLGYILLTLLIIIGYFYHWHLLQTQNQSLKGIHKPEEITWLDEDAYLTLTTICDSLLPSLTLKECTEEKLTNLLSSMPHPFFYQENKIFIQQILTKQQKYLLTGALEYGTHKQAAETLQIFTSKEEQFQLYLILKILSTTIGTFLLTGYPVPYHNLPLKAREGVLKSFRDSKIGIFRTLFQVFKRLICVLYFSFAERGTKNPTWDILDYHPENTVNPNPKEDDPDDQILKKIIDYDYVVKELKPKADEKKQEDNFEVDAVIVGSGCGGGIMAEELVQAGFKVLMIEKGGYFQAKDFAKWRECEGMAFLYEKGGLSSSEDGSVVILSGSNVGGGSTLNWSASFRTPEVVVEDWANAGMNNFQKGGDFEKSLDYVTKRMNVNSDFSYYDTKDAKGKTFAMNENNRLLWKGAEKAGYKPEKIPRNVKNCVNCGHCSLGCSFKSKQSTIHAILEPILLNQYRNKATGKGRLYIIPDCKARRIVTTEVGGKKTATGIEATATIYAKEFGPKIGTREVLKTRNLTVKAKVVVCSAGSIQTPALLLNSKFTHPKIGKYLTLHPVLGCGGIFPEIPHTELHSGVSMGVVVRSPTFNAKDLLDNEEDRQDALRHNVAIETPPIHVGLFGLIMPWSSGLQFKLITMFYKHYGVFLGFARDHCTEQNYVTIDKEGNPKVFYQLLMKDEKQVMKGLEMQLRFLFESNAKFLFIGHSKNAWYYNNSQKDGKAKAKEAFEKYLKEVWDEGIIKNTVTLFSAHQMSSCRMSASTENGPTSPTGELYECDNLFLADGSVLPTSLGINPMITIEAMSHMISKNVVKRLKSMK